MTHAKSQTIDLRKALDKHLNARSLSKSISTLLESRRKTIDFTPYYQRNYVWDTHKATFFVESILLGIEVPPLIMFIPGNNKKKYEVIDGRQRFETLKRFFDGDFKLTKTGLRSLTGLKGKNFQHLKPKIQRIFLDTTIRIIEFSVIGDPSRQDELEDRIKKEIFWRYNSGITPLKTLEVQRAQHLEDNFTAIMKAEFSSEPIWLDQFKEVFFAKKSSGEIADAECQAKIRDLLILEHFPINIYASTSVRRDTVEWLYELYIEGSENQGQILQVFIEKVGLLHQLFTALKEQEWLIYQGVYWALVILEQNDIDIGEFIDEEVIDHLVTKIHTNISIFTGDDRTFYHATKQRFQCLADFFLVELKNKELGLVDFTLYLNSHLKKAKNEQKVADGTDSINQLETMRLNRPDAVSKTIEDLIRDMGKNAFLIRPSYQRQEVINIKKASGIIESMLLGIPLPTIFIYRRADDISEVVDGQQRLLSILAFLGQSYRDSNNKEVWSKKNHFKLFKKITVLKKLGGEKYDDLDEDRQDLLWDFELSVVYIDGKLNKEFDPIDLFIRLNNKPYPVKDHSFEMWNSNSEREIIERIQLITKNYESWFYYRKDNRRMHNEELLTLFAYLSFKSRQSIDTVFTTVDMYNWAPKLVTFRVSKILISEWLNEAAGQDAQNVIQRDEILASINEVDCFIQKVEVLTRALLQSTNRHDEAGQQSLEQSFDKLLGRKGKARLQRPFYMLWFLLLEIDKATVDSKAQKIAKATMNFIADNQIVTQNAYNENQVTVKEIFKKNVASFWEEFNSCC